MSTGHGNETLARDAMFAVIMIVLNGMVGLCLLLGGWRYREQAYNLQGANAFLAVIVPLAVLGLVLPNFTVSVAGADVLAAALDLPDRHVGRALRRVPGDPDGPAPGLLRPAVDRRPRGCRSRRPRGSLGRLSRPAFGWRTWCRW